MRKTHKTHKTHRRKDKAWPRAVCTQCPAVFKRARWAARWVTGSKCNCGGSLYVFDNVEHAYEILALEPEIRKTHIRLLVIRSKVC